MKKIGKERPYILWVGIAFFCFFLPLTVMTVSAEEFSNGQRFDAENEVFEAPFRSQIADDGRLLGLDLRFSMGNNGGGCGTSASSENSFENAGNTDDEQNQDAAGSNNSTPPIDDSAPNDDQNSGNVTDNDDETPQGAYDLPDQCSGACNSATPVYPTVDDNGGLGNVTMYTTEASDGGACNYGTTNVMYFAAMSVNVVPGDGMSHWQGGSICGQCAEVTAVTSQGPKKVVVRIMDKCPDGDCGIDLGGAAPAKVMVDGFGRYDGSWRLVSCDGHPEVSDGPPTLDVINGSNEWWSRVHVRNGSGAVDSITWVSVDGSARGSFPFATNPENAYEVPQNEVLQSGLAGVQITVHYRDGGNAAVTLSPSQLGVSGASYPLD